MYEDTQNLPAIDALHASLLKLVSAYATTSTIKNALAVVTVLQALTVHPGRKRLSGTCDVYEEALLTWKCIANESVTTDFLNKNYTATLQ